MGSFRPGMLFHPMRAPLAATVLAIVGMALGVLAGTADRAVAQGAVKSVHSDWQVRCDTPPGARASNAR